jgi:hypothetical protein
MPNFEPTLHTGLLPDDAYQMAMPADVLEARTGVPAIDQAVCELYPTGSSKPYLFNADNVAKYAPASWHSAGTAIGNRACLNPCQPTARAFHSGGVTHASRCELALPR